MGYRADMADSMMVAPHMALGQADKVVGLVGMRVAVVPGEAVDRVPLGVGYFPRAFSVTVFSFSHHYAHQRRMC